MIEVINVWKQYGDDVVLEHLNTRINEGDFATLVGTSGCGKSTFLRMILGVERPTKGQLLLDGEPLKAEPDESRGIVFQHYSVFPHLSVLRNVMLVHSLQKSGPVGWLFGKERRLAREEATAMLGNVGLQDVLDRYPHELSGGMRQRLAIAQTLMASPRILLLDEPFAALDPGVRADMHELVSSLWKSRGLTVVMVTHSISEGFSLGTRVLVFDKVRHDPHAPKAYGARITYDIPLKNAA